MLNAKDTSIVEIREKTNKVLYREHFTRSDDTVTQTLRHERFGTEKNYHHPKWVKVPQIELTNGQEF